MNGALVMTYQFRPALVLALGLLVAACGGGGPSLPGSSPAPLPLPPGSLTAELTPSNNALLQWEAPPQSGFRPVTGYEVYVESAGERPLLLHRGGQLSYTHLGLSPGHRYVYHVRSVNAAGRSGPSQPVFVDVPPEPSLPPLAPENFTAELTPHGEVMFQWTAPPPAPGRVPVTDYAVYRELPSGRTELLGTSDSFAYLHPGLTPNARYVFHVRARSVLGLSQPSAAAFLDLLENLPPYPEAPGSFTAEHTVNGVAQLSWTAPAPSPDRSAVTGYAVYRELPGGTAEKLAETGADSLSYVFAKPEPGTRYIFHVRALSAIGPSRPSASASIEVVPGLPPFPEAPGGFTAVLTAGGDVFLSWTSPPPSADRSPVTGYEVYRELPDGTAERLVTTTADSLSYVFTELTPGPRYVFHVRALSAAGPSLPSTSAFVDVPSVLDQVPEPPGNFTATLTPTNEALLQWTAPVPADERAPVTGYVVYVSDTTSPSGRPLPALGPGSVSYLHSGLLQGVSYVYHVRAQSDSGLSQPSASASVNVAIGALVRLVEPHLTVRADEGAGKATISWAHSPQSPDAGVPTAVSGFSLQYCVVPAAHKLDSCPDSEGWQELDSELKTSPATRLVDDGEINCTSGMNARMYRIRAIARNDSLSSRYSEPTPPVCPHADYAPPRRVTAVFATPPETDGNAPVPLEQRVNICWNPPVSNGNDVAGYELQIAPDTNIPSAEDGWLTVDSRIAVATPTVCVLYSGVVANQVYWFRVRAYNRAGHGNWSAPYQYRHGQEFVPGNPVTLATRASVNRPSAFTVSDARASERSDASLTFEVMLDRPTSEPVTVDYATSDGTATAGDDYRATSGTLELAAGETSKTIEVAIHADTEDEGEETLTLRLSNPAGARIEDGEATGTILDRDPLPKEWLARFGRTVAAQAVDAVGTRLVSEPRTHARVGGVSLETSASPDALETQDRRWTEPARNPWDGPEDARGLSRHALMSGSSFHLASEGDGPVYAAWGRFAAEGFEADVHDTRLDGDTTTGFLGADVAGGRWLMGAAVSHSEADGSMVPGSGTASARERSDVESTLTGVYPYARMTLSERVSLWGLAGAGHGTLTVSERGRAPVETDIGMNMGALGARGTMLAPSEAGDIEFAVRSDAFWVRMTSDEARTAAAGDLADIRTDASRVRLFLEAEREFEVRGEGRLTPSLKVGVRHDGGDAETGTGLEAGAGMRYAAEGIAIEGAVRRLVTHEDSGYAEWSAGGSVRIDPGASGRGLSLTLAPTFGAGSSDTDRLWSLGDARSLSGDAEIGAGSRLEAEVGYGWRLPITTRGTFTPYTGLSFSDRGTRAWRLGARLMMTRDVSFGLEGTRREHPDEASDQAVVLHGRLHW